MTIGTPLTRLSEAAMPQEVVGGRDVTTREQRRRVWPTCCMPVVINDFAGRGARSCTCRAVSSRAPVIAPKA